VQKLVKSLRCFDRQEGVWGAIDEIYSRNIRNFRTVDDTNFSVNAGETVAHIGAIGVGKSTSKATARHI